MEILHACGTQNDISNSILFTFRFILIAPLGFLLGLLLLIRLHPHKRRTCHFYFKDFGSLGKCSYLSRHSRRDFRSLAERIIISKTSEVLARDLTFQDALAETSEVRPSA